MKIKMFLFIELLASQVYVIAFLYLKGHLSLTNIYATLQMHGGFCSDFFKLFLLPKIGTVKIL